LLDVERAQPLELRNHFMNRRAEHLSVRQRCCSRAAIAALPAAETGRATVVDTDLGCLDACAFDNAILRRGRGIVDRAHRRAHGIGEQTEREEQQKCPTERAETVWIRSMCHGRAVYRTARLKARVPRRDSRAHHRLVAGLRRRSLPRCRCARACHLLQFDQRR